MKTGTAVAAAFAAGLLLLETSAGSEPMPPSSLAKQINLYFNAKGCAKASYMAEHAKTDEAWQAWADVVYDCENREQRLEFHPPLPRPRPRP